MKSSPFNACDYLCEKCVKTEDCGIYAVLREKALSKQADGSKDQPGVFLEDVKESLDEAMEMLEEIASDLNIDLQTVSGIENIHHYVDKDELYQLSLTFALKVHGFLKKIEPLVTEDTGDAFDDIVWYHSLVPVKTHRAIHSDYDGMAEDAINSARVAVRSLVKCILGFRRLEEAQLSVCDECRSLARTANGMKGEIEKRFVLRTAPEEEVE